VRTAFEGHHNLQPWDWVVLIAVRTVKGRLIALDNQIPAPDSDNDTNQKKLILNPIKPKEGQKPKGDYTPRQAASWLLLPIDTLTTFWAIITLGFGHNFTSSSKIKLSLAKQKSSF